jgi:hypothetical protein
LLRAAGGAGMQNQEDDGVVSNARGTLMKENVCASVHTLAGFDRKQLRVGLVFLMGDEMVVEIFKLHFKLEMIIEFENIFGGNTGAVEFLADPLFVNVRKTANDNQFRAGLFR